MNKLTTKQHLQVIHKCADSITSDDMVVRTALRESADALDDKLSIWKGLYQLVQDYCHEEIIFITNDDKIHIGMIFFDDFDGSIMNISEKNTNEDFLPKQIKKCCYIEDLINQAKEM